MRLTWWPANDGWAVGNDGTIFRYDGVSWAHYETLPSGVNLYGLDLNASNYGWAVGDSLPSTSPSGGFPPTILRWNGAAWTVVTPSGVALGRRLNAVDILSMSESWAVGSGSATIPAATLKWDGTIWTSVPSGTPAGSSLFGVEMLSPTDGWAVGCTDPLAGSQTPIIIRWNGLAWSAVTTPIGIHGLRGIFMLSPTNGWAVGFAPTAGGQATIIHWDGSQWTSVPGPIVGAGGYLSSIHMVSPTDGWAVGFDAAAVKSLIVHWDGITWNVVATLPLPPTMAVSLNSVFMVGLTGRMDSQQSRLDPSLRPRECPRHNNLNYNIHNNINIDCYWFNDCHWNINHNHHLHYDDIGSEYNIDASRCGSRLPGGVDPCRTLGRPNCADSDSTQAKTLTVVDSRRVPLLASPFSLSFSCSSTVSLLVS